jgi:hypothetical protein
MKELVDRLVTELKVDASQARGGAAVLLSAAKDKLGAEQFTQLLGKVPGVSELMQHAPAAPSGGLGRLFGGLAGAVGGNAALIAKIVSGFGKLGLEPNQARPFARVMFEHLKSRVDPATVETLEKTLRA